MDLHDAVEEALAGVEVERENRRFVPHITYARFKRRTPSFSKMGRYMKTYENFVTEVFPVEEFVLYASKLTPQGPRYTREAVYPLASGADA